MSKASHARILFSRLRNEGLAYWANYQHRTRARSLTLLAFVLGAASSIGAEPPIITIEIRGHLFYPAEFQVPAGTKVKLMVINQDATPEEFESYELNREKVIMGGATAIIFIGPLKAGRYPFFGEFNPKTAQGMITVGP